MHTIKILLMPTIVAKALRAIGLKNDSHYSNLKPDEHLVFFNTCAWLDEDSATWNIPVHGWVYEPQNSWPLRKLVGGLLQRKYDIQPETTDAQALFKQRLNLFIVDNERRKRIVIELEGQLFELPMSEPNGQFHGIIKLTQDELGTKKSGHLRFDAQLRSKNGRDFSGRVELVSPRGVSVISDIDDTIKQSFITDRKKMFEAAFFQPFKPVNGMPEVYRAWRSQGASFHYVSSSPWQLYEPLEEFAKTADFPPASYSLKKVRIKDETFLNLFKSGLKTKPAAVKAILNRYPNRKFVLVGDSGEQDAQVYAQIARQHPTQIVKILIRNVHASKTLNQELADVFAGLPRRVWKTFVYPSQIKLDLNKY